MSTFTSKSFALLLLLALLPPGLARADSLSDAFTNLLTGQAHTAAETYKSKSRITYTLGGYDLRFKSKSVQLVSIAPPSLEAGCNGISAHFGGLSFVTGDEIVQLLTSIGSGQTLGFVFVTAVKSLCGLCGEVMDVIQRAAQLASLAAIDSCQASQLIAEAITSPMANAAQDHCRRVVTGTGEVSDHMSARDRLMCGSKEYAKKNLQNSLDNGDITASDWCSDFSFSNSTWCALRKAGLTNTTDKDNQFLGELMMSTIGTLILGDLQPPTMEPRDVLTIFLCGTEYNTLSSDDDDIKKWCEARKPRDYEILRCLTPENRMCDTMEKVKLSAYPDAADRAKQGFLKKIKDAIKNAVVEVKKSNGTLKPEHQNLIALAPFPLYQLINVAAVYPEQAEPLLRDMHHALAHMVAHKYIEDALSDSSKFGESVLGLLPKTDTPPEAYDDFKKQLREVREKLKAASEPLQDFGKTQEAAMKQIKEANKSMLESVYATGISGLDFARGR